MLLVDEHRRHIILYWLRMLKTSVLVNISCSCSDSDHASIQTEQPPPPLKNDPYQYRPNICKQEK